MTSPPDGYTLLMATNAELVMHPSIYPKLPYDPLKDLVPISIMVESPLILLAPASSPFNSVADFVAAAKAKPGTVTYSTAGTGSTSHVLTEMLAQQLGISLLHVPYKGGAPASAAIASGEVNIGLLNLGSAIGLMRRRQDQGSGDHQRLAQCRLSRGADRVRVGRARICRRHLDRHAGARRRAAPDRRAAQRRSREGAGGAGCPRAPPQLGAQPVGTTPEEAAARIRREEPRFSAAIKKANIRVGLGSHRSVVPECFCRGPRGF